MREDFFIDENELMIAVNKMFGVANYYVATLEKYISIMSSVKDESINDELICGEIADIISEARDVENMILNLNDKFRQMIIDELKAVEDNSGTFVFPDDPDLASIFAL